MQNLNPQFLIELLSEAYPGLLSYIGADYKFRFASQQYSEWFDTDHKEIIGKHPEEIIGEENFRVRKPYVDQALKGHKVKFTSIFHHKSLGLRDTEQIYFPDVGENGEIRGFIAIIYDITEQKNAHRKAEEKEDLFRTYAESMPQMAFIADSEGRLTYLNKRWMDYTGLNFKELKSWEINPIHEEDFEMTYKSWQESIRTGNPYEVEHRLRGLDGKYRWFLARAMPLRNSRGRIDKWVGTKTDIDDQKKIERNLEDALKSRDEFLSIASHELKTPLTSLKLQSQLTLRTLNKSAESFLHSDKQKLLATQTNELVSRLARLIDDMLDVSRLRTGKMRMEKNHYDLTEIVSNVISQMSLLFENSGLSLPIIKTSDYVVGYWDRFRIEQVISNLLTNAIRYGKGKPIEIEISQQNGMARLVVKDQGFGISAKDTQRIFECFERAINPAEVSGMGLGLFISQEIIKSHQGQIWVESELGKGSTFFVELPMVNIECAQLSS